MSPLLKKIISITSAVFLAWLLYYGSFLPLRKAQKYIEARQTQVSSLPQFNAVYDGILGYRSPVGQEELVSNYMGILSEIIVQEKNKPQPNVALVDQLVQKAEEWGRPIIDRGTGFSYSQVIFSFGSVYQQAFMATRNFSYYEKAIQLYEFGLKQSPDRQVFLYSLFDIYRFAGNIEEARRIGIRIVEVYNDGGVNQIKNELPSQP
ncbi:MAG: tetratricopeptide repeat protein [Candidatus Liptonbacteria bacterium]|nr:tetratricopeptide repeat protein [Candidatus Liptonbacteria bacterium]